MTHCFRRALVALLAAFLGLCHAAPPVPVEHFFRSPTMLDYALSPGGTRLAFTARGANERVGLYVVDLETSPLKPSAVALFNDADIPRFDWVGEERLVFSTADLAVGRGEITTAPGLYAVGQDGKGLRTLIERSARPVISDGREIRTLPWNHALLHVPVGPVEGRDALADEVIIGEQEFANGELIHLEPMWLNVRTGMVRSMSLVDPPRGAVAWWFTPQGDVRAVATRKNDRTALRWFRTSTTGGKGEWTTLAEAGPTEASFLPLWVGRGDLMYVSTSHGPQGEQVVARYDFARNAPGKPLVLTPGFDFNGTLHGDERGERLLGVTVDADARQTLWFDPARKALQARADAALPERSNAIDCRRCEAADAVMLVHSSSDRNPGELLLWRQAANGGKGGWLRIGRQRPGIDEKRMGRVDLHRIRARDGRDLPVWTTLPADAEPGQPRPAVVLVHGGPWVRNGHWRWDPMAQFLASRGYTVIEPEFRGSDGYGAAHLEAGFKQWGQAMQDDVADALLWAQKQGLASDKACIVGASYGGYSTLMGLIRHPQLYRCGSAWVAVTDPFLFLEGSWLVHDDISRAGRRFTLPERVGDAQRDREMLLANSPVAQAHRIQAPLQLIWGKKDERVPIQHGYRLRDALRKAGKEPEWIVYGEEAHGWDKLENQVDMALKLERFLARHLGP